MNTTVIPAHQVAPLWAAYHGLPAEGHPMRAAVVIEPTPFGMVAMTVNGSTPWERFYRVTSGQPLEVAQ